MEQTKRLRSVCEHNAGIQVLAQKNVRVMANVVPAWHIIVGKVYCLSV